MVTRFRDHLRSLLQSEEPVRRVASLRPTLYIGLGGFGCTVLRRLKTEINDLIPEHANGFAYLGMDTHPQPLTDVLTLNEYVPLSVGINPSEAARAQPRFLGWYRELVGAYQARNIQAGADKVKAVGRLAFRHQATFQQLLDKLASAMDTLARFRDNFAPGAPMKVYVISTLAGGTGAGCLLDVLAVVGKFFRDAVGADFPYQAIVVTPDVLQGEAPLGHMPEFCANTYATLKEIHSFLSSDNQVIVDYDEGRFQRVRLDRVLLPDPIHFIGDKNEAGTAVVSKIEELADIVVSYLLSEIQTPMEDQSGQPKVQDMENVYVGDLGQDGMPRAFSSFGVVRTGFPADVVEHLFMLRLVQATLDAELHEPPDMFNEVSNWLDAHNVKEAGTDQLQDQIKHEVGTDLLKVSVDVKGTVLQPGFRYDKLVAESKKFQQKMEKALHDEKKKIIEQRGKLVIERLMAKLQETFDTLVRQNNLGNALTFLQRLEEALKHHQGALKGEITDSRTVLNKQLAETELSLQALEKAVQGFWGRGRRVEEVISDFDARLESLLTKQVDVWVKEKADEVYAKLLETCKALKDQWTPIVNALKGHRTNMGAMITKIELLIEHMADIGKRGPGNRFSLINSKQANLLYDEIIKPDQFAAIQRIRTHWLQNRHLTDTKSNSEQWLNSVAQHIIENELEQKLRSLNFTSVLERFYTSDNDKRKLFQNLQSLSSPLFWLDPNRREPNYDSYWIIAVHPDQKAEFSRRYETYLPGQGRIFAYFDSPHEVILYQLKFGYTVHSYRGLRIYEAEYKRLQEMYREGKAKKRGVRPIHCWVEAEEWEDLIPSREAEEAGKWFILGRAFSYLFPTPGAASPSDRKNVAFLYARGSNYYLQISEDQKPELVGKGLAEAVRNFSERADWQQTLRNRIEDKIAEVGEQAVRDRLESEYLPILKGEIETAERNPDPRERERAEVLRKLLSALRKYIEGELRISRV